MRKVSEESNPTDDASKPAAGNPSTYTVYDRDADVLDTNNGNGKGMEAWVQGFTAPYWTNFWNIWIPKH